MLHFQIDFDLLLYKSQMGFASGDDNKNAYKKFSELKMNQNKKLASLINLIKIAAFLPNKFYFKSPLQI